MTDLPHTTDARVWAKEFIEQSIKVRELPWDYGAMIGWFANAIMAGYDKGRADAMKRVSDECGRILENLNNQRAEQRESAVCSTGSSPANTAADIPQDSC